MSAAIKDIYYHDYGRALTTVVMTSAKLDLKACQTLMSLQNLPLQFVFTAEHDQRSHTTLQPGVSKPLSRTSIWSWTNGKLGPLSWGSRSHAIIKLFRRSFPAELVAVLVWRGSLSRSIRSHLVWQKCSTFPGARRACFPPAKSRSVPGSAFILKSVRNALRNEARTTGNDLEDGAQFLDGESNLLR